MRGCTATEEVRDLNVRPEDTGAPHSKEAWTEWRLWTAAWFNAEDEVNEATDLEPWYRVASQRNLLALDNGIQQMVDPIGLKLVVVAIAPLLHFMHVLGPDW